LTRTKDRTQHIVDGGASAIWLQSREPAKQMVPKFGIANPARYPERAGRDIAAAMIEQARDGDLTLCFGRSARERGFCWNSKANRFNAVYRTVAARNGERAIGSSATSFAFHDTTFGHRKSTS
jgi:hypothetical protein